MSSPAVVVQRLIDVANRISAREPDLASSDVLALANELTACQDAALGVKTEEFLSFKRWRQMVRKLEAPLRSLLGLPANRVETLRDLRHAVQEPLQAIADVMQRLKGDEQMDAIEGFSDAEIAEQIAPMLAEVDADYDRQFDQLVELFEKKGPPQKDTTQGAPNPYSLGMAFLIEAQRKQQKPKIAELAKAMNVSRQALYENAKFAAVRETANKLFGLFAKKLGKGDWQGPKGSKDKHGQIEAVDAIADED